MSATIRTRRPRRAALGAMSRETLAFRAATALVLVHALDDAFLHRQPGVGIGRHALAAVLTLAAGVAGAAAFPRLRPGLRTALAYAFGGLACVNGAMHAIHVAVDGPARSDLSGLFAAAGGLALVSLAAAVPWRHRGERSRPWLGRAIGVPATLLGTVLVLLPVGLAILDTHKFREPIGAPPSAAYEDVGFRSIDGLAIAGWYRPSRNGAAVLVVHGGGSDRTGAVSHARMLERHGYGVLLYDARGRGESEGSPNSYGWDWEKDAVGALRFLQERPDVDSGRIGGLGLSSGADTLVDVAASHRELAAVVGDGTALRTFEDAPAHRGRVLSGGRPRLDELRRDPRPLGPGAAGAARGARGADRAAPAPDLGRPRAGVRLQRRLRACRPALHGALEPPRRRAHRRPVRASRRVRATGRRLLRRCTGDQAVVRSARE